MNKLQEVVTQNLLDDSQFHVKKGTMIGLIPLKKEYRPQPPFKRLGDGKMGKYGKAYPLIETMLEFSKPESWLFKILLKTHSETTGFSNISKVSLTKTEQVVMSKAYKLLNQRELVRKVKRQVYMVNPSGLITDNWKEHLQVWESLAPKPPKMFTYINPKHLPRGFWIKSYKTYNRATGTYTKP